MPYLGGSGIWGVFFRFASFLGVKQPTKNMVKDESSHVCLVNIAGKIITTSAEVTFNSGLVRDSLPNPLDSGLVLIVVCPDIGGRVVCIFLICIMIRLYKSEVEKIHLKGQLDVPLTVYPWYL